MAARRVRPTIRQVADRAGVSPATVSNALNGTGRLSEETRGRVVAAARELSYLPYTATHGATGVLGLTMATYGDLPVPYTEIPYYAELILACIRAAHERGYLLVVLPATMSSWAWLTTPLDGVVHCEPRVDDPVRSILEKRDIPLVYAGRPVVERRDDAWIDTDDGRAVDELLDHLRAHGARRVAAVLPDHDDAFPATVRAAYLAWCARAGQEALVASFVPGHPEATERVAVEGLLDRPDRPDAAFGLHDRSGSLMLDIARERGLAVPHDLAVATFCDDPGYAHLDPPVTTVSMRPAEVGAGAVDMVVGLINARRGLRRRVLVPATLQVRASSQRDLGRD